MRSLIAIFPILLCVHTATADAVTQQGAYDQSMHRYLVERTFPISGLDKLDAQAKKKVDVDNTSVRVRSVQSYANAEGASESTIRKAVMLNKLPIDNIAEVPVDLKSGN